MSIEAIIPEASSLIKSVLMSTIVASAFIIGSIIAIKVKYSPKIKGDFAAMAAGIFFAAIAFSLVSESSKLANIGTMILGFILGAVVYSFINHYIRKRSKYRTHSSRLGKMNKSNYYKNDHNIDNDDTEKGKTIKKEGERIENQESQGSSQNVIIGTILDSIPETIFIGVIIAMELHGLLGAVIALFLGNLTATLNGAKLMLENGVTRFKILKEWSGDFALVAAAGPLGYFLVKPLSPEHLSIIIGFAAGTLMIFVSRELIPQAYNKDAGYAVDMALVSGFLITFLLFHYL